MGLPGWIGLITGQVAQGVTVVGLLIGGLYWMSRRYGATETQLDAHRTERVEDLKARVEAQDRELVDLRAQLTEATAAAARAEGERDMLALERDRLKVELARRRGRREAGSGGEGR